MKIILMSLFISLSSFGYVSAQTPTPTQPSSAQVQQLAASVQGAASLSTDQFIADGLSAIGQFQQAGLPVGLKIALICLMLIALTKTSFIQPAWNKLGAGKAAIAPILGMIIGYIFYGNGGAFSWATTLAFMASGVGATGIHELLDMVKAIPGIGVSYVSIINLIEGILGAPKV